MVVWAKGMSACLIRRPLAAMAFGVGLALAAAPAIAWAQGETQDAQADPSAIYQQGMEAEWQGNYERARELHQQAADLGYARSHYQLGFLLQDGLGGPRDTDAAREHLRVAADGGITLALVPYLYSYDDQDDPDLNPDAFIAAHALLELALRDLGMAGDTIQFWSQPMRRQVQVYLQEAGFYRGPIDGLIGQGSLNALRAFARNNAPLPPVPTQRFMRIVVAQSGITSDDRPTIPLESVDDIVDARVAFAGALVEETDPGHLQISLDGAPMLDWPFGAPEGAGEEDARMAFQLPGKPQRTQFAFGMLLDDVAVEDLRQCTVRMQTSEAGLQDINRCETRVQGVNLVFVGDLRPLPTEEAQESPETQETQETQVSPETSDQPGTAKPETAETAAPTQSFALNAIELTAPPSLRLTDQMANQ